MLTSSFLQLGIDNGARRIMGTRPDYESQIAFLEKIIAALIKLYAELSLPPR